MLHPQLLITGYKIWKEDGEQVSLRDIKRRMLRQEARREVPKLSNRRANLREANPANPGERCGNCIFFRSPDECTIVVGPVTPDLVCDWIQSRGFPGAPLYRIRDKDWIAFGKGMIAEQPYQHIVRDVAITPEGPMVLIEDTAKPVPHRFSLSKPFHVEHTSWEHHWTQDEVDRLVRRGRSRRTGMVQ